jgi:lipoprotein-anchoring transpeptidase ErfK/SrfK
MRMTRRVLAALVALAAVLAPVAAAGDTSTASTSTQPTESSPPAGSPADGSLLLPDGVSIGGVSVGGMTVDQARAVVQAAFETPLPFFRLHAAWTATPAQLGATANVDAALQKALDAPPGATVDLPVSIKRKTVRAYIAGLSKSYSRPARDARVRLVGLRPRIEDGHPGVRVLERETEAAIFEALRQGERDPVTLPVKAVPQKVTRKQFRAIIVIRRGSNRLLLYRFEKRWRTFGVATGQATYPTPLGHFSIVVKQRDPWWYPPASPWAQGEQPVPPGPGNPLGTRWMGLSAPLVGIHGTPDAASIGYSASHGCIRMRIPDAEWLFDHVSVGTPVFIVAA